MSFRTKKSGEGKDDAKSFEHASGYTDLESVLGDHTLNADREAVTVAPKGYRARSIAKSTPRR
ncbi:MAG TPA: hypothetical protein VH914_21370 [Acidimicrobiia bacterium]|jgi:hypothetical protein|nr:hypothetical protein [Acidimicrobiia bacterium]